MTINTYTHNNLSIAVDHHHPLVNTGSQLKVQPCGKCGATPKGAFIQIISDNGAPTAVRINPDDIVAVVNLLLRCIGADQRIVAKEQT